jgi:hypothetical protein
MKIEDLTNYQIVTLAVALLGGTSDHIDPEDIAVKVDELVSGKFNWRKYPNRIDLNSVNVALRDAKKEKNSNLLVGNNQRGWMLSPNGLKWVVALSQNNEFADLSLNDLITKIFTSLLAEKERLLQTKAYQLFKSNQMKNINKKDFFEFTRTNEYFKVKAKERRYTIIENTIINHPGLIATWQFLIERFIKEKNNDDK